MKDQFSDLANHLFNGHHLARWPADDSDSAECITLVAPGEPARILRREPRPGDFRGPAFSVRSLSAERLPAEVGWLEAAVVQPRPGSYWGLRGKPGFSTVMQACLSGRCAQMQIWTYDGAPPPDLFSSGYCSVTPEFWCLFLRGQVISLDHLLETTRGRAYSVRAGDTWPYLAVTQGAGSLVPGVYVAPGAPIPHVDPAELVHRTLPEDRLDLGLACRCLSQSKI